MVDAAFYREISSLLPGRVRQNEPMKKHTTWHIGGPSDIFVDPASREDLQVAIKLANSRGIPLTVIGNGSNLLVSEAGIRGIVVKIAGGLARMAVNENKIISEAGAKLSNLAALARDAGLGGLEFSAGIPGTVGGAVAMNAGANGSSVGKLLLEVLLLSYEGDFFSRTGEEMNFGYRRSILQQEPSIVVEASFLCYPQDRILIKSEMDKFLQRRKATQPLGYPNAGSVFKNPPGDSAGRLIEAAKLKGERIGDAQISNIHANFIVNLGSATSRDVLSLIERAQEEVRRHFGIELSLEVKLVGEH